MGLKNPEGPGCLEKIRENGKSNKDYMYGVEKGFCHKGPGEGGHWG